MIMGGVRVGELPLLELILILYEDVVKRLSVVNVEPRRLDVYNGINNSQYPKVSHSAHTPKKP